MNNAARTTLTDEQMRQRALDSRGQVSVNGRHRSPTLELCTAGLHLPARVRTCWLQGVDVPVA